MSRSKSVAGAEIMNGVSLSDPRASHHWSTRMGVTLGHSSVPHVSQLLSRMIALSNWRSESRSHTCTVHVMDFRDALASSPGEY